MDCQGVALASLGLDIYYIVQHARVVHPYIKTIHSSISLLTASKSFCVGGGAIAIVV
jgi:hypothetical protein